MDMKKKGFVRYVPNSLSTGRIFLACLFPFSPEQWWIWLILGSGLSDILDGWVARHWQVQSWQGGLLDAIADKLFVLCVLSSLVAAGKFSSWWLLVLLARDMLVVCTAVYALTIRSWDSFKKMDARLSGKAATFGQFFFFIAVLLFPGGIYLALAFAALLSGVAACDYGWLFLKEFRSRAEKRRSNR